MSLKLSVCFYVLLILLSCSHQDRVTLSNVVEVNGSAQLIRDGVSKSLENGTSIIELDEIIVSKNSKVKVFLYDGSVLYINSGTKVNYSRMIKNEANRTAIGITLENGKILLSKVKNDSLDFQINTPNGLSAVPNGDVFLTYNKDWNTLSISALSDSVIIRNADALTVVPSCTHQKFSYKNPGQLEAISESEIFELKRWLSAALIENALSKSGCIAKSPAVHKLPPEWVKMPKEICSIDGLFVDTVKAADPEGMDVLYSVSNAPSGLIIDKKSGIIKFTPKTTGKFPISLHVRDTDSMVSSIDYSLTVISGLGVILNSPKIAAVNRSTLISAYPIKNDNNKDNYLFRFDYNGDGIFDFPSKDEFSITASNAFIYSKEGDYKIKVEMKDSKTGTIVSTSQKIEVRMPPKAVLKISPKIGQVGSEILFDATECNDFNEPGDSLLVHFDMDNDGIWDVPSRNGLLREKKIVWSWNKSGKFTVTLGVVNRYHLTDTTQVEVTVADSPEIESILVSDSVHIGDTVLIQCNIKKRNVAGIKYEWNFDSDTIFEVKSENNIQKHVFKREGKAVVRCRVTDENGYVATQQKNILIVNSKTMIDAGGEYNVKINQVLTLKGTASDSDSKIISYGWDLNGDGKPDSVSKSNASVTCVFSKSGKKTVHFFVTTDDGSKWKDSAIVNVSNSKPVADAGKDIVSSSGKKIKLKGIGTDEEQNIVKYEWDFDGDGKYDWSSDQNGVVVHAFNQYSNAVFKVTDSDDKYSLDTVKIIICPDEMSTIEQYKFCIDKYEFPGKKGGLPSVNVSYDEAQKTCIDQGKHLCTEDEWKNACTSGMHDLPYPYGKQFEKDNCNTIGNVYIKNKIAPSGEFPKCTGNSGAFDMSGNAAEWVYGENQSAYVYGGSWQNGRDESKCDSKLLLQKGRKYFYVGFRCCK